MGALVGERDACLTHAVDLTFRPGMKILVEVCCKLRSRCYIYIEILALPLLSVCCYLAHLQAVVLERSREARQRKSHQGKPRRKIQLLLSTFTWKAACKWKLAVAGCKSKQARQSTWVR